MIWKQPTLVLATLLLALPVFAQDSGEAASETEPLPVDSGEALPAAATAPMAESADLEYSVTELQQLLNSPTGALLKEFQEDPGNQRVIFGPEQAARLFGEKPPFVYFPEGPDPMIIPWVRSQVIAEELMQEANVARAARDFEKAKQVLRRIQEEHPETPEGQKAPAEIAGIDNQIAEEVREKERAALVRSATNLPELPQAPQEAIVELPPWVRSNTNGVLIRETGEMAVVVDSDFLRPGQSVPRYPPVKVKEITASRVVFTFENKEFPIEVVGAFGQQKAESNQLPR